VTTRNLSGSNIRLLVAIASFGEKNLGLLKRIIRDYQNMAFEVDVIVVSDSLKDLGSDVKVVVGLPSKNPWSLPFAHKAIFAERVNHYDLFAYSEDDMAVTEANIRAFLRLTPQLQAEEIAGYLRYEISSSGIWSLPDVHGSYHWKAETVRRRGAYTIAQFTNEHAAFYLLTQDQLRRAIASGGFLRDPYSERYDMLCTAATDPYTNCGFRKVICVSAVDDFMIHHLSNRYVGQLGISLSAFKEQVQTLLRICDGVHPVSVLCQTESKMPNWEWSKSYYEEPRDEIVSMIPSNVRTVLSVGCGWGATEAELQKRGASLTALPLDSVIGASAERLGLDVVYGSMSECSNRLNGRNFECVLVSDLLHLQSDPKRFLEQLSRFVRPGGTLVIAGPNFDFASIFIGRALRKNNYKRLGDFAVSGIRTFGPHELLTHVRKIGFGASSLRWHDRLRKPTLLRQILRWSPGASARRWVVQVRHCSW